MKKLITLFVLIGLGFSVNALAVPKIQTWTSDAGAKVMFVPADSLPMVDVRVVFDAGGARDGDLPGLATFTNALLTEGAGEFDAAAFAENIESRGIQIGSDSLRDMAWLNLRSLTEPEVLSVGLARLSEALAKPRFDQDAIERIRDQMHAVLRQQEQSPSDIASREFYATLFAGHPYGVPTEGTKASVDKINLDAINAFHKKYYVAKNAVISIVGAQTREQAEQIANQVTRDLPQGEKAPLIAMPTQIKPVDKKIDYDSSQSHVYLGMLGMSRHDPDYIPLYVGNQVLGGGSLVSLLGEEVRNKRGLSYSVYSYFSASRQPGPFVMVAQTKNTQVKEAADVMKQTLSKFANESLTEELLKDAKQNIVFGFPMQIANNSKMVGYISMIGFYDMPIDWLERLPRLVNEVTLDEVKDAFNRRVKVENLSTVVVGG
ncbi:MAG: M16 family metallopeptidase [Sedimenticolaceae bacterium]